jgi:predicted component of type VI protein secretion system
MPESTERLRLALERVVARYEPRLKDVKVRSRAGRGHGLQLEFILSGEIQGSGTVRFQTTFTGTGNSTIAQWRGTDW